MGLFGEYLVERGAITRAQLEETVRTQVVYGGRIGTSLLERGFMQLEDLAHHLSQYQGFPLPEREWLATPDEKAIKLVSLPLIRRCRVLPLRVDQSTLWVAMMDPRNPEQIALLEAASARSVVAYVLPEARLSYWLEVHHGIDRHPRMLQLAAQSRQIGMWEIEAPPAPPATQESLKPLSFDDIRDPGFKTQSDSQLAPPAEPEETILLEDIFTEPDPLPDFEFPAPADEARSGQQPMSSARISHLEAQLHAATERDDIVRLGLEIALYYSRAAGLFLVRGGIVSGHRGHGEGMSPDLSQIHIPINTASIFVHPAVTRTPFRGEPPADGIDGRLLTAMGRPDVRDVLIMPIGIGDRVVNLLYADNGPDGFGETSIAALTALCDGLSRVYERVILERKKAS